MDDDSILKHSEIVISAGKACRNRIGVAVNPSAQRGLVKSSPPITFSKISTTKHIFHTPCLISDLA